VLVGIIVAVLLLGTVGYVQIEDMRPIDGLYMTSITVTTVGFKEVHPLSDAGKIFTIVLMFLGIGVVVYAITLFSQWIIEPALRLGSVNRRMSDDTELLSEEARTADVFEFVGSKEKLVMQEYKVGKKSPLANKQKIDILKKK